MSHDYYRSLAVRLSEAQRRMLIEHVRVPAVPIVTKYHHSTRLALYARGLLAAAKSDGSPFRSVRREARFTRLTDLGRGVTAASIVLEIERLAALECAAPHAAAPTLAPTQPDPGEDRPDVGRLHHAGDPVREVAADP